MPRPSFDPRRSSSASVALTVGVLAGLCALPALAQAPDNSALQRQIDDAFRQVLSTPGDLQIGLAYARLQVQAGNYEGAIAAMERMLLVPDAPASVRLELGILYFRLASYAMAEAYLRQAAADPRLPPEQKDLANRMLKETIRQNQPNRLTGYVMAGVRGQTNPTTRTEEDFLKSGGALVPRTASQKPKSDTDFQVIGRLEHTWDLETQNSAEIVSTLFGVASHYSSVSSYTLTANPTKPRDLLLVEGTTGLRFKPAPAEASGWTVRPHLILGNILLDGHQYAYSVGAGLETSYQVSERLLLNAAYEGRNYTYASRIDVSEAKAQGGFEHTLRMRASYELFPRNILVGELIGRDHNADRDYFAYVSGEARLSYVASYDNPFGWDNQLWTSVLSSGITERRYDGADAKIDAGRRRNDTEWRTSLNTTIPLNESWSVLLQGEYTKASSNLPNYNYSNTSGLASIMWRF